MVVVPALDQRVRTKLGAQRTSSGHVKYSAVHAGKLRLDAEAILAILREVVPHGHHFWTLPKLEKAFTARFGRLGSWVRFEMPFAVFFDLFPRTFQLLGARRELVRLLNNSRRSVVEESEEAVLRLALARREETNTDCPESRWAEEEQEATPRPASAATCRPTSAQTQRPASAQTQRPASAGALRNLRAKVEFVPGRQTEAGAQANGARRPASAPSIGRRRRPASAPSGARRPASAPSS